MELTFGGILAEAALWSPDKTAVSVDGNQTITYRQLYKRAAQLAIRLRQYPGQNIGILLPNSVDWIVSVFGIALAGKTAVLLNTRLTTPELVYQIAQSNSHALLTGQLYKRDASELISAIKEEVPSCETVIWWGDNKPAGAVVIANWLEQKPFDGVEGALPSVDEDATAVIIYTSGTTSLPKGVMLSHYSVVMNALVVGQAFGASEADRVFSAGPFAHSGGLTMHVVLSVLYRATAFSVSHFDAGEVLDCVESNQCTIYNGIDTLFLRLVDAPNFSRERVRSVRTGWATGSPSILRRIADEVGMPGIIGVYGISEASPNVLISHYLETEEHRLDTVGRPHPWMRASVWNQDDGEPVNDGEIGELVLSGYSVMQGYYNNAEETEKALRHGWLHTGDLVRRRSDGYFEFAGRSKDIIRIGGENVSALEVEDAIHRIHGVVLAAIIPVADSVYGEIPVAVVKRVSSTTLSSDDVMTTLNGCLASYKVPKRIIFRASLPLTSSGKVQKKELKRALENEGCI